MCWLNFGARRSKVKVTASNDPKTLWTPYLKNQWRECHPILVTDVYGLIDVQIRFCGHIRLVKVTSGNDQKNLRIPSQSHKLIKEISPRFGHRCTWVRGCADYIFGSKIKGQGHSRQWPENLVNNISLKPIKRMSPNFGHKCIWVHRCAD